MKFLSFTIQKVWPRLKFSVTDRPKLETPEFHSADIKRCYNLLNMGYMIICIPADAVRHMTTVMMP